MDRGYTRKGNKGYSGRRSRNDIKRCRFKAEVSSHAVEFCGMEVESDASEGPTPGWDTVFALFVILRSNDRTSQDTIFSPLKLIAVTLYLELFHFG